MKIQIFYSWQSADPKHNKNFIYNCLNDAIKKLNRLQEFKSVEINVTDAIRNETGQVPVADLIISKVIPGSDIFLADLTGVKVGYWGSLLTNAKAAPNSNVMTEYGVAISVLGKERIISVINTSTNGLPRKNPEIIPFDLRHDRFPTEFDYSKKNESKKSDIKKKFVDDLVAILKQTIQYVLETQKTKYHPFVVWNELNLSLKNPNQNKFIGSAKFEAIKDGIVNINNANAIRILGLSGLGKTRILLEIFRPDPSNNISLAFSNRLLYVNCNDYQEKINFVELIRKISKERGDAILVVDNCDIDTHKLISKNIDKLCFISIDSNPEENPNTVDTNYIIIGKNDLSTVVENLVDTDFQACGQQNIEKIKEFAQGIPLMAVLLAESVTKGEKFLGKLDDKDLLDKLLGSKGKEQEWRSILKSCSMFSYIGYEGEVEEQYKFVARNKQVTISNNTDEVRISTFLEVVKHFREREIFEKQGRFLSIRPFPLAMALAVEWLDTCTSERILQVITDISNLQNPHRRNLINSLSDQMKYLGYNDRAVEIVKKITDVGGPFDSAEVLNTELGSRLFRSFVEVNPVAVSENFKRLFLGKSKEELISIDEGRRNLIWVFEKLCFDKRTFIDSAKILMDFAIAENETWANNASGQFLHLFNIFLAGTEANLRDRWSIIKYALSKGDKEYTEIAVNAMKRGLNFGHFSRMGGAEQQGIKRLKDYEPSPEEIHEYWQCILSKLTELVKLNNEISPRASVVIAESIRMIFNAGEGYLVLPYLKEILEFKKNDWDEALTVLKQTRKYEKNVIGEEMLAEIEDLIHSLTKTDFVTRYLALSSTFYLDDDETFSPDKVVTLIRELADEFIREEISWGESFEIFFRQQHVNSYNFGKKIGELLSEDNDKSSSFIDLALKVIRGIDPAERNFTMLGGFMSSSNESTRDSFYERLFLSADFSCNLFYFVSIDTNGYKHFDKLFRLVEKNDCVLSSFYSLTYSEVLQNVEIKDLSTFAEKLFSYGEEGYELVFDLFYDVGYRESEKKELLKPVLKQCIFKLGYKRHFKRQLDDFKWSETICSVVSDKNESKLAEFINTSIIRSISWDNSYHLDNYVGRVYEVLLQVHFDVIWTDLSQALLATGDDYVKFYGLKHILGAKIGGYGHRVGLLFEQGERVNKVVFDWCENNIPLAPERLAELIPIFDNDNNDYGSWHPLARQILDRFGKTEEVISNLSANMGTFSWIGSVVPYLEGKKQMFEQIVNHEIAEVRNWANTNLSYLEQDIEKEKNRDAERFL